MPTKGERTRAEIVRRSAALLNARGFLATPVSAIVAATGIQKGGLYRHFASREALGLAALDFAVAQVRDRFLQALADGPADACGQLLALLDAYDPATAAADGALPLPGGCPIMNAAIEADHADPALRARAQAAMKGWQSLVQSLVARGISRGEIRADADPQQVATVFIACIEGAVMLSHLQRSAAPLAAVRAHLHAHVEHMLRPPKGSPP